VPRTFERRSTSAASSTITSTGTLDRLARRHPSSITLGLRPVLPPVWRPDLLAKDPDIRTIEILAAKQASRRSNECEADSIPSSDV
jgi:hypothetical protein